jgi:hypothetical protein
MFQQQQNRGIIFSEEFGILFYIFIGLMRRMMFINLPKPSGGTGPLGLLSL